jgi:hypothetical protein
MEEIDDKSIRQAIRDIINHPQIYISNEDRVVLSRFAIQTTDQSTLEGIMLNNLTHFTKYYEGDNMVKMSLMIAMNLLQKKVDDNG